MQFSIFVLKVSQTLSGLPKKSNENLAWLKASVPGYQKLSGGGRYIIKREYEHKLLQKTDFFFWKKDCILFSWLQLVYLFTEKFINSTISGWVVSTEFSVHKTRLSARDHDICLQWLWLQGWLISELLHSPLFSVSLFLHIQGEIWNQNSGFWYCSH